MAGVLISVKCGMLGSRAPEIQSSRCSLLAHDLFEGVGDSIDLRVIGHYGSAQKWFPSKNNCKSRRKVATPSRAKVIGGEVSIPLLNFNRRTSTHTLIQDLLEANLHDVVAFSRID